MSSTGESAVQQEPQIGTNGAGGGRQREKSPRRGIDPGHFRQLLSLTRRFRPWFLGGLAAVAVSGLLSLALPLLARELFNRAFEERSATALQGAGEGVGFGGLILLLVAIFIVQAGFNFLRVYLLGTVGEGVVADLRKRLFGHLLELPVPFFDSRKTGEITSRLTADVATVQAAVSQGLAELINQAVILIGACIVLVYLNAQLTLVMLAIIPPVMIAGVLFGRRLRKVSTRFQDSVARANAYAEEAISGIRVVKAFSAGDLERRRYAAAADESFRQGRLRARARALFIPTMILSVFLGVTVVMWFGGQQVLQGTLAAGDLVAFLVLMLFVAGSTGTATNLYSQLQEATGASQRIFELLGETPEDTGAQAHPKRAGQRSQGHIAFENVSFGYGDRGSEPVLEEIDLEARPGEVVALVGPSGAGKSTLISLIPRFYEPDSGRITLDGTDLQDMDLAQLREQLAMVPQETQLFSGSIRDNIRYGAPDASDEEVREAASAANATDFIEEFPEGFDTEIGERGVKLSGGQRQRVAIARALLKDPRILILDEATSSLDSESEALVQAALDTLMAGRTTFVIAHRLATILRANRIIVLDRGRIVERGTHADLLARDGLYSQLYRRQFRETSLAGSP